MLIGYLHPVTRRNHTILGLSVLALVLLAVLGYCSRVADREPPNPTSTAATPVSGLPTMPVDKLPREAVSTLALIDAGGPFPYDKDGSIFANAERLPRQARGYYREYTVPTPGSRDRGARRLVVGSEGDVYYTADHYESFRQVLR